MTTRSQLSTDVRAFMALAGQALPDEPTVPSNDVVRLRLRLIAEEFCELLDAVGCRSIDTTEARNAIDEAIELRCVPVDLVETADALADLRFVIVGTDLACGIDGDAVDREVARSNASKFPTTVDANGKVKKGAHYSPPDIASVLRAQGWEP